MSCCSKKAKDMMKQAFNKAQGNIQQMMHKLTETDFLTIDAKVDWIECLQCCEQENKYEIHQSQNDQFIIPFNAHPFATFTEKSDCCCRLFVRHTREFKGKLSIDGFSVATTQNKYKCHSWNPFCSCPCDFPQLDVVQDNKLAGMIRVPYYVCCCGKKGNQCSIMEMDILDANGQILYRVTGNCCQKSVCFLPFMCCGCEQIRYDIREPATIGQQLAPGQTTTDLSVGSIRNVCRDCPEECFTKADRFGIEFPKNADAHRRMLIVMCAIYLDYCSYEY